MRVALVAYGCEPGRGSELGVGWHWAKEVRARGHDVIVYVHAAQKAAIEASAMAHVPGLTFRFHQQQDRPLEHKNRLLHQLHYILWQWSVMDLIAADARDQPFDLVHFVTWGGVRMPTFGFRSPTPYMVGPIGGGEEPPLRLLLELGPATFARGVGRMLLNRACLVDPLLIASAAGAHRILLKMKDSRRCIPYGARSKCAAVCEIGSRPELLELPLAPIASSRKRPLRLLFAGRMLYWKAPLLLLDVYRELMRRGRSAELTLVGDGPQVEALRSSIEALPPGAQVRHLTTLPQPEFFTLLHKQDFFLFPSLHDSTANVVLEAMAAGTPVIALAIGGPNAFLSGGGGVAISPRGSKTEIVGRFADAIIRLADDPDLMRTTMVAARTNAKRYSWAGAVAQAYGPLEALNAQQARTVRGLKGMDRASR
jgi:glycosyltransferase involved in cell wall biosynthesis